MSNWVEVRSDIKHLLRLDQIRKLTLNNNYLFIELVDSTDLQINTNRQEIYKILSEKLQIKKVRLR